MDLTNHLSSDKLVRHYAKIHEFDKPIRAHFVHTSKCRFCSSRFETKDDMNEHISLVHSFNCQSCTAKFQTSEDLRQHETLMHKFQCQFCPKKFAKKKHMDHHAKFIHQNTGLSSLGVPCVPWHTRFWQIS